MKRQWIKHPLLGTMIEIPIEETKEMETKPKYCSICQREFSPEICHNSYTAMYGNNAQPVNDGKCCDRCNTHVVIPARINQIYRLEHEKSL
jgi:hypothetical protein